MGLDLEVSVQLGFIRYPFLFFYSSDDDNNFVPNLKQILLSRSRANTFNVGYLKFITLPLVYALFSW